MKEDQRIDDSDFGEIAHNGNNKKRHAEPVHSLPGFAYTDIEDEDEDEDEYEYKEEHQDRLMARSLFWRKKEIVQSLQL